MTTTEPDDFEPATRTYTSQGLTLSYLDWGNAGAPLLLLVHGSRDQARCWDWTARALRREWHVVASDLRGHGDSQWSPDAAYLSSYYVMDFADLVESLGDTRPLTIVGHSLGGGIVSRYAACYPERMKKLVIVDGLGPSVKVAADWAKQGPAPRTREWIEKLRKDGPSRRFATLEEAAARMAAANPHLSKEQSDHLARHGVRQHPDGFGWKYDPRVSAFPPEEFTMGGGPLWGEIACPTLIMHGAESWTGDPIADGRTAMFKNQHTVVFEKSGHWLHHDQFDAFITALRAFI